MKNIVSDVNIGYNIPNIKRLVNIIAKEFGITEVVHIIPMRVNLDDSAYVVRQGGQNIIYVNNDILDEDRLSDFVIKMFIHELWHVQQYAKGLLVSSEDGKKVIWRGVEYDNSLPHGQRPWEKESRKLETHYIKRIKNNIKNLDYGI